jgi:diadenylate cyclase
MEIIRIGFLSVTVSDLIDIIIVGLIAYKLYMLMRATLAIHIFIGLLLVIAFSFIAQALDLKVMTWILKTLSDIWVIAFIILFAPEIRRLLVYIGRNRLVRIFIKLDITESVDEIVGAAAELSEKKQGALIVLVRSTGIRSFIETGHPLEARVSKHLLVSIFNPKSPLHDGAVVIKDRIIEAARVTLPISERKTVGGVTLGMRHKAALGISEQSDVIVVIVSEETGTISIAENGELIRGLTPDELHTKLEEAIEEVSDASLKTIFGGLKSKKK